MRLSLGADTCQAFIIFAHNTWQQQCVGKTIQMEITTYRLTEISRYICLRNFTRHIFWGFLSVYCEKYSDANCNFCCNFAVQTKSNSISSYFFIKVFFIETMDAEKHLSFFIAKRQLRIKYRVAFRNILICRRHII